MEINNIHTKLKACFVLIITSLYLSVNAQTVLQPGDLVFTMVNADGNDDFQFLLLKDVKDGTKIYFTDNAYHLETQTLAENEGTICFTADKDYLIGSLIHYPGKVGGDNRFSKSGSYLPSGSGDNLLVYTKTEGTINFIYGIGWAMNDNWVFNPSKKNNTSDIPEALQENTFFTTALGKEDNYRINLTTDQTNTQQGYLAFFNQAANYESNSSTAYEKLSISFTIAEEAKADFKVARINKPESFYQASESILSDTLEMGSFYMKDYAEDDYPVEILEMRFIEQSSIGQTLPFFDTLFIEQNNVNLNSQYFYEGDNHKLSFPDTLRILNADSINFSLKAKSSQTILSDHEYFLLQTEISNWKLSGLSSKPKEYQNTLPFDTLKIQIETSRLFIEQRIDFIELDTILNIKIFAVDSFENTNKDESRFLKIFSNQLVLPDSIQFSNGMAQLEKIQFSETGNYKIRFSLESTNIDDLELNFQVIGKQNSLIKSKHKSDTISVSGHNSDYSKAVLAAHYSLHDLGGDNLPSILKEIRFKAAEENECNWTEVLKGIQLEWNDQRRNVAYSLAKDSIIFYPQGLEIADNDSLEIKFWIWFQEDELPDTSVFKWQFPGKNFVITETNSSGFKAPNKTLCSRSILFSCEVISILFYSQPKSVEPNQEFYIKFRTLDAFGNIDRNLNEKFQLHLASGQGKLTALANYHFENGICTCSGLSYSGRDAFRILCKAGSLGNFTSKIIQTQVMDANLFVENDEPLVFALSPDAYAQTIFRFKIKDQGIKDDLPVRIQKMIFETAGEKNLSKIIETAYLIKDSDTIPSKMYLNAQQVKLSFNDFVQINSGDSSVFELAIKIRNTGLQNGDRLQLLLNLSELEWEYHPLSSRITNNLNQSFYSDIFQIQVKPEILKFFRSSCNDDIQLRACDKHLNFTNNYSGSIKLEACNLYCNEYPRKFSVQLEKGKAIILNEFFDTNKRYLLKTRSEKLKNDSINLISSKADNILNEDFENSFPNWEFDGIWRINEFNENKALFLSSPNSNLQAGFQAEFSTVSNRTKTLIWNFDFVFEEFIDSKDSVRINLAKNERGEILNFLLNKKGIELNLGDSEYKTQRSLAHFEVMSECTQIKIQVTLQPEGVGSISFNSNPEEEVFEQNIKFQLEEDFYSDQLHIECKTLEYELPGKIGFNRIAFQSFDVPNFITKIEATYEDKLNIYFNKSINEDVQFKLYSENLEHYIPIEKSFIEESLLKLEFDNIENAWYKIEVNSFDSEFETSTIKRFFYQDTSLISDLIINEIKNNVSANETYPFEFIELLNPNSYPVETKNWKLIVDKEIYSLPHKIIQPDSFLLIVKKPQQSINNSGAICEIPDLKALYSSEGQIALLDKRGRTIHAIHYYSSWQTDSENTANSFELIDAFEFSNCKENWHSCTHENGASPLTKNSKYFSNDDIPELEIKEISLFEDKLIKIILNQGLDSSLAENLALIELNGKTIEAESIELTAPYFDTLQVDLKESLEKSTKHELMISASALNLRRQEIREDLVVSFGVSEDIKDSDLLINEILFNPKANNFDYVEIYNQSTKVVDLSKLKIVNKSEEEYFSETSQYLFQGEYLAITENIEAVASEYFPSTEANISYVKNLPSMPDDEGFIKIIYENETIDSFTYKKQMHLEFLEDDEGVSLERIHFNKATQNESNWQSAAESVNFGTPGYKNSQHLNNKENLSDLFEAESEVFSPDGDAYHDFYELKYELKEAGYSGSVVVFDSHGKKVKEIFSHSSFSTSGTIKWDGSTDSGKRADVGMYLIFIEMIHHTGEIHHIKKTCVLAIKP